MFVAETARQQGHTHVLLITTGSVASIKAPLIVSELLSVSFQSRNLAFLTAIDQYANVSVQVVATNPSLEFYKKEDIAKTGTTVWTDADEWTVGSRTPCSRQLLVKYGSFLGRIQDWRADSSYRTSTLGRHRFSGTLFCQHTFQNCPWSLR